MPVSFDEFGWMFIAKSVELYQNGNLLFAMCILSILYLLLLKRREKVNTWSIFALVLGLTVFNVFFAKIIIKLSGMEAEYYRFFWLFPGIPLIVYAITDILAGIFQKKNIIFRMLILASLFFLIVVPGKTILSRAGIQRVENIYKVPNDFIVICEAIHEDSIKENPVVVLDFELMILASQYDPSLDVLIDYEKNNEIDNALQLMTLYDMQRALPELATLCNIRSVVMEGIALLVQEFEMALENMQVEYVVIHRDFGLKEYIQGQGCTLIFEAEEYELYRVDSQ